MRALALRVLLASLAAAGVGCAMDAGTPVSESNRENVRNVAGSSGDNSTDPTPPEASDEDGTPSPAQTLQVHRQASVKPGDNGPTEEPIPVPWRHGGGDGPNGGNNKSTQKKDGPLRNDKIRDMIQPLDDGKDS